MTPEPRGEADSPPTASAVTPFERSWASTPATRNVMRANRRRDTTPELAIRRLLHRHGYRYRVDFPLPFDRRRRADIVFTRARVAIFVDGCFWHGCPLHYVPPRANPDYWRAKVERNRLRDRDSAERLEADGWTVLRFWEHESPTDVVSRIEDALGSAQASVADADAWHTR